MTRALVTQLVEALEHGYMVTGAHAKYTAAITAARAYLATEPSGERAELIQTLQDFAQYAALDYNVECIDEAIDMLEADAQHAKRVPMTEKQIDKIHADTARLAQIRTTFFIAFARAIEAHHGITPAGKPTGWNNGLSQDYCAEFGQWLASRPGARQQIKAMFDTSTPLQP